MRHIIKNFHSNNKALLIDLFIEVQDGAIINLNPVLIIQLFMLLRKHTLALLGKLRRNFDKNILARSIQVQTVVFVKIQDGICEGSCAWADFDDAEGVY
jgi:cephalosporin-C deacetylase-like acetyl esterase